MGKILFEFQHIELFCFCSTIDIMFCLLFYLVLITPLFLVKSRHSKKTAYK